ncbi:MAG: hypothetical protein NT009_10830 [Proteobacteria bacterium]|nr:hypothetical protein [Pseudomonadota bacterium]
MTDYFEKDVLRKRRYLSEEICRKVIKIPIKKEIQSDGRIRFWGKVEELEGKYIRIITLEDGIIIHNAFIDRGYKS